MLFPCSGANAEKLLYIQPHGDDIIQISAKVYMDTHQEPAPDDVHVLFTGNSEDEVAAVRVLLEDHLTVDPGQVYVVNYPGPITHKTSVMADVVTALETIDPDKVFIQGWCGSHPGHEMSHIEVVKAAETAGVDPEIYEYPTFTGAFGPLPASPTIYELSDYWNSLIDLDPAHHSTNPSTDVVETPEALEAKEDLILAWGIPWMIELYDDYEPGEIQYFISQEKYRLLGEYDYLREPYVGDMSYEFLDNWPYVFEDLRNYTLCLDEAYGADLLTSPTAYPKKHQVVIPPGDVHPFKVGLANKASVTDSFTLSAWWGYPRVSAGGNVTFQAEVVEVAGENFELVNAWIDTTGLSGEKILWIKAESGLGGVETDFVEIPYMIKVSGGLCGTVPTLTAHGPADRASRAFGAFLYPAFPALFLWLRRSAKKKGSGKKSEEPFVASSIR